MSDEHRDSGSSWVGWAFLAVCVATGGAFAVTTQGKSRLVANQNNAGAALKQLVNHESIWRQRDLDGNGVEDYWTRDVAGLHCVHDRDGKAANVIDRTFARSDTAPGRLYAELGGDGEPRQGYHFRAMLLDQDGRPYIDDNQPFPGAANAPVGACTNPARFGFTAFPADYGVTGALKFVINEDGTVWQHDFGDNDPILDRQAQDPLQWGDCYCG